MARAKDIGDLLVEDILTNYWDNEDFEEWLEYDFSRRLAKLITGKEKVELEKKDGSE